MPRHDIYKVALSPKGDVQLSWWLDYAKQMVTIRVDMSPEEDFDWFAVGFSYYGDTKNADYCIMRHLDDVGVIQVCMYSYRNIYNNNKYFNILKIYWQIYTLN